MRRAEPLKQPNGNVPWLPHVLLLCACYRFAFPYATITAVKGTHWKTKHSHDGTRKRGWEPGKGVETLSETPTDTHVPQLPLIHHSGLSASSLQLYCRSQMQPRVSLKGSKPLINFPATYQGAEPRLVLQHLLQQTRDLSVVPRLVALFLTVRLW